MTYTNPPLPEGTNADQGRGLKEFAVLSVKALVALVLLAFLAVLIGGFLGRHIPFSWERALANAALDLPVADAEVERALQDLADRVAGELDLPPGMTITVRYVDSPVVNAAATIGGTIIVYRGLLARVPSENALAMLLGHEIAHVRNRDVAANLGSGALLSLITAAVSGQALGFVDSIANGTSRVVSLRFSREAERAADRDGLQALIGLYGHIEGAEALYDAVAGSLADADQRMPEILRSHPLTDDRTDAIDIFAVERGYEMTGRLMALEPALIVSLP